MTISDYTPSEIEIRSLGVGLINTEYLDLNSREYLVVGDVNNYTRNETVLEIGQQQTTNWNSVINYLRWIKIGEVEPLIGNEIINQNLSNALLNKNEFSQEEYDNFLISDSINQGDYIKSGNYYYKPENINDILPKDIKYSMIVNNTGIGLNTSRNQFDSNFALNDISGIYIENGDIVCKGTISAKNIKIINDEGVPYVLSDIITDPEKIIENLINAINENVNISKFSQGWNTEYISGQTKIVRNNIYTNNYISIGAGDIDTINNLHPVNIVSDTATCKIENIHIAIKNKAQAQPITYENSVGEKVYIKEPSSFKMGIIGSENDSPAIISTTYGMPLEFHVSKSSHDINKLYNINDTKYDSPQYNDNTIKPSLLITKDGNVCVGNNEIEKRNLEEYNFQVSGTSLFDKIYIKKDNNHIELDDLYIRKTGVNLNADDIGNGNFKNGDYIFDSNLTINNNLFVKNNLNIENNLNITNEFNANKINIQNLNINSDEISIIDSPVQFKKKIIYENELNIDGSLYYQNYRLNALNVEKIENLIVNDDGSYTTEFGSNLTQNDLEGNVVLYYGINQDSTVNISSSNLIVPGNLSIGLTNQDNFNNNNLTIKNNDVNNFEILIEDSELLENSSILNKTHIGHINLNKNLNDKSLIFNTNPNGNLNIKRNIYFYPGESIDNISKIDNNSPTLSIYQTNKVGINLDININPSHELHINGDILTNNIYINHNNKIKKANVFLENETNIFNNRLYTSYFLNTENIHNDNNINKYFINLNHKISDTNFLNNSKGLNVDYGINSIDGYFENNIRLANFKFLNGEATDIIRTSYINANLLIGINDLSDNSKDYFKLNNKPLMIRNITNNDNNDSIIRLYRGVNNDINNLNSIKNSLYTGIDFCEWNSKIGNKEKDKWYIYRNHLLQNKGDNYPGALQIGYTDNELHPTKSGLDILYRRNQNISINEPVSDNDTRDYYFVFNKPNNTDLFPNNNINDLNDLETLTVYGNIKIYGTIFCDEIQSQNGTNIVNTTNTNNEQTSTNNNLTLEDVINTNDVNLNGYNINLLYNNSSIIANYDNNVLNLINNNSYDNIIFYNHNNSSISSFIKPYNDNNKISYFDLKTTYFSYDDNNNYTSNIDINYIKFCVESIDYIDLNNLNNLNNSVKPSLFSLKNNENSKLISFYNTLNHTYINIGTHNNNNFNNAFTSNISLHIEDKSSYLLQLTNYDENNNSKINLHNKNNDINNYWIIDGPNYNNNNLNFNYAKSFDNLGDTIIPNTDTINNILTLTSNNTIGINNNNPEYTLDINSDNKSALKITNNYINNNYNNDNYYVINVNNSNLVIENTLNINNNSNIIYNKNFNIDSIFIPDYDITNKYINQNIKNKNDFIKYNNYNNLIDLDLKFYIENVISNHNINFDNINQNYFKFNNYLKYNDFDTNIIDINSTINIPSFSFENTDINEYEISNSNLKTDFFTSNFNVVFSDNNTHNFNISNLYHYIDGLYFNSTITNLNYEFNNDKNNLFIDSSNFLLSDNKDINTINTYVYEYNSNIQFDDLNLEVNYKNYLIYEYGLQKIVNIDLNYKTNFNYNIDLNIPTTLYKNENIFTNIIENYYENNINYININTSNYLKNNILGSYNIFNINNNNFEEINKNINIDNINLNFDSSNISLNDITINLNLKQFYENYIDNTYKHYLFGNIINDIPHIIFNNSFTDNKINEDINKGINTIYSTNDGDFKINYTESVNNIDKTLIEMNKNGNISIDNGSLYVKNLFVENILDIYSSNNIITNSNHLNDLGFVNLSCNFNLSTSNFNVSSSNITFNIDSFNNSDFNIKKTTLYQENSINNIFNIDINNDIEIDYNNILSISTLNNSIYTNFGNNNSSTKIGIGKDIFNTNYALDVNGQIKLSANNIYNTQSPHIILDTNERLLTNNNKKYNNNFIYSSDGKFSITAIDTNNNNNNEKNLLILDDGNIESDSLKVNSIITKNIYDDLGNSLIPGFANLNDNEYIFNEDNIHMIASNVQFTTSNINIAIFENKDNYFNINKVRPKDVDSILESNINFNLYDIFPFDNSYLYKTIEQFTENYFITSVFKDGINTVQNHDITNNISITESGVFSITLNDGDRINNASYGNIIDMKYDNTNNLLYLLDNTYNKIRVINYNDNNNGNNPNGTVITLEPKITVNTLYNYLEANNNYIQSPTDNIFNITIENVDGSNKYIFNNNDYNSFDYIYLQEGTYYFNNIPSNHPFGFVIDDNTLFEVTSGTLYENTKDIQVNGNTINVKYYTGNITVDIKGNYGTISYDCYHHGYMGGENKISYNNNIFNVSVQTVDGSGKYIFNNNDYNSFDYLYLPNGTYHFNNISSSHPFGFVINNNSLLEVTSGTLFEFNNDINIDGNTINVKYYTGNITVVIKGDYNIISYHCYYHGYMGGENKISYINNNTFNNDTDLVLNNPSSLILNNNNDLLYISDVNYLYSINISNIKNKIYDNIIYTIIIGNLNTGFQDGNALNYSKFDNILYTTINDNNDKIYLSDNYSIRELDLNTNIISTIAGYPPNLVNSPRSGISIGDGVDTRFMNVNKMFYISFNNSDNISTNSTVSADTDINIDDYLIILDYDSNISRVLILDLVNNYVSTIYESEILNINSLFVDKFDKNNIYLITNNPNNIYKLVINSYDLYKKSSIIDLIDNNNIFSITSIPHDSVNIPYYSMHNDFYYNFNNENGYLNSMSVKTNKKRTLVKFGNDDEFQKAYIGISCEPNIGTELLVGGTIDASNLNIYNSINTNITSTDSISLNIIESKNNDNIMFDTNIVPKLNSIYNIGTNSLKFGNIFIGATNNINIGNVKLTNSGDRFKITDYANEIISMDLNQIYLKNNNNAEYATISYNDSRLVFETFNDNNTKLSDIIYDANLGNFETINIITNGNINCSGNILTNSINSSDNSIFEQTIFSSNIDTNYITINSNLLCKNNAIFNNDLTIKNDFITSNNSYIFNDLYTSNNLYVFNDLSINNDFVCSNNAYILSDLTVSDNINTNTINTISINTSNLNVIGETTFINTSTYQTENLEIINNDADGPSFKIINDNLSFNNNIIETSNIYNNKFFIIDKDANLGINTNPSVELDINGSIKVSGSINNLTPTILNNLESLDDDINNKFINTSNYINNISSNVINLENTINNLDYNKIDSHLHPIVKEFDSNGNLTNTYDIYDFNNNNIFYKSNYNDTDFYIILKNNSINNKKHYRLSLINNLLADILLVGGGGAGLNNDFNNNILTERINTNISLFDFNNTITHNIYTINLTNNDLLYYELGNKLYYISIYNLNNTNNNSTLLLNNIHENNVNNLYPNDIKVSYDNSIIVIIYDYFIIIYNLINHIVNNKIVIGDSLSNNFGNINGEYNISRFNIIKSAFIYNNNKFILITDYNNHCIKKINISNGFVSNIVGSLNSISGNIDGFSNDVLLNNPIDIVITHDDNFAYFIESFNNIKKINLKTLQVNTEFSTLPGQLLKLAISNDNTYLLITVLKTNNKYSFYKYDIFNKTYIEIPNSELDNLSISVAKFTNDDSSILYITNNIDININTTSINKKYIQIKNNLNIPAPGGAGGVLYRENNIIPKGIYDLYVGNGANNFDMDIGINTEGFGATAYGGSNSYFNYNDLNIPGSYNGYNIENSYILNDNNNEYQKLSNSPLFTHGGSASTFINSNIIYNGYDGFYIPYLDNDNHLNIPSYFGGGSGSYNIIDNTIGNKGLGGGTDSININDINTSNILQADNNSGAGSAGGYNKTFSLYPIINNTIYTDDDIIYKINYTNITVEYFNIKFDLNTKVNFIFNYSHIQKFSNNNNFILNGSYTIELHHLDNVIKIKDNSSNTYIIESTNLILDDWSNIDPITLNKYNTEFNNLLLAISYLPADSTDNSNFNFANTNSSNLIVNDYSKAGSGIIIIKYNINFESVNSVEYKLDRRLKLLEESLLFSRINSYTNINLNFYKNNPYVLYSKAFIDQSYSGITVPLSNNFNISNLKFVWSIKYKISSVYNDFIPNQLSSTLNYISYTNSINLRNISYNIISNEQFIYIDSINLTIFDNIYDPDNKAYLSSIDYYVDSITPIIYQNVPIYKNIFTNRVSIYPLNNNNIVDNLNYFNNTISNNTNIVSFNYNNDISINNQSIYQFTVSQNILVDLFILAGGGSGGSSYGNLAGGGGGAGELLIKSTFMLNSGSYYIKVGKGGDKQIDISSLPSNGYDSGIFDLSNNIIFHTNGGGYGGGHNINPSDGGSGGGSAMNSSFVGSSIKYNTDGLGFNGSFSSTTNAGNGGGAGGVDFNNSEHFTSDFTNNSISYASGGIGGFQFDSNFIDYGLGSGGGGAPASENNSSLWQSGENGNDGIIIIKYSLDNYYLLNYNNYSYSTRWSSSDFINEPFQVFNNDTNLFGCWKNNQFNSDGSYINLNKLFISSASTPDFGEWIIIKFHYSFYLKDIKFLLKDNILLNNVIIGATNFDDINNDTILNHKFNKLNLSTYNISSIYDNQKISINDNNTKYNTYAILISNISNSLSLKINNIELFGDINNWEDSLIN